MFALILAPAPSWAQRAKNRSGASDPHHSVVLNAEQQHLDSIPAGVLVRTDLVSLTFTGTDCDYRVIDSAGHDITKCWMLHEIPVEIASMTDLEILSLPLNGIRTIPPELSRLHRLRELELDDNAALENVDAIAGMARLETLGLCGCNVSRLPADLSALRHLRRLCLKGNPMTRTELARIRRALPRCRVVF
ncbi:MAG: leucine-rich repeat domain-containing protein [Bacteroidetes bacterium]|nr:leucine-rich repeat domain-containing protein [Bacteroidota bacterium]